MQAIKIFVTGTDTNVGKTYISTGLLKAFSQLGYTAIGIKPVASGGFAKKQQIVSDDGLALNAASSIQLSYNTTNFITFKAPVAPNIAASQTNVQLTLEKLINKSEVIFNYPCDIYLIEGVGGWAVPLNDKESMEDYVEHYKMKIVLVVGIRLGCINHARLTYAAIKNKKLRLMGWIANCISESELEIKAIIQTISAWLDAPLLGIVAFNEDPKESLIAQDLLHYCGVTRGECL